MGNRSLETCPFKCVVMDKVIAQLCMYVCFVCVCVRFYCNIYHKDKGRDIGMDRLSYL